MRLGRAMAACLGPFAELIGELGVPDPAFTANHLYTQALGTLHLARVGVGVTQGPSVFAIDPQTVRDAVVADALRACGVDVTPR